MRSKFSILTACVAAAVMSSSARATLLFSIAPTPVNVLPNSTGDSFDVVVQNTGPGSVTIGTFFFEVSVSTPGLTLTGANFSTVAFPYIFAGQSIDQDFSIPLNFTSGSTLDASDSSDSTGKVLGSGASLALGHVVFNVGSVPVGQYTVTFSASPGANSLSDPLGNNIPVGGLLNGQIDVVPEPATALLVFGGMTCVFLRRLRQNTPRQE